MEINNYQLVHAVTHPRLHTFGLQINFLEIILKSSEVTKSIKKTMKIISIPGKF